MLRDHTDLAIGLILIGPGVYLLWYANGHEQFYQEQRWKKWRGRAYLISIFFDLIFRYGGIGAVKRGFRLFALACIAIGIWAIWIT